MNNQVMNAFFLRHTEDTKLIGGEKAYEEDTYLNQNHSFSGRNRLRISVYGDCLWRSHYRQNLRNSSTRTWWAFELVTEGDGIFVCDNIRYELHPGDIFIIRPDNMISFYCLNRFLRKKYVLIEGGMKEYICKDLQSVNVIRPENPSRMEKIYSDIKQIILAQGEFVQEELEVQAYALLVELNRLAMPIQYPSPLCQALKIIDANPRLDHTLNNLSIKCNVSISTLSKLFQHYLKTSPMKYVIDRRLEHARQLIKLSNMQLKEISERCGYNSESFLSRSFKKKFGISPASYRRS